MARAVELRDSFIKDIGKLSVVIEAIEMDDRRPAEWRNSVLADLRSAVTKLINAPSVSNAA